MLAIILGAVALLFALCALWMAWFSSAKSEMIAARTLDEINKRAAASLMTGEALVSTVDAQRSLLADRLEAITARVAKLETEISLLREVQKDQNAQP
jgi:hypothetical protein